MALVNRIQNGQISQDEIDREEENIESQQPEAISDTTEPSLTSGPLVVVNQQDEPQPSTSAYNYTPAQFSVSENLSQKLLPEWLETFYFKIETDKFSPFVLTQIKNIISKIMEKDPKFKITGHSVMTSQPISIKGDPTVLFLNLIKGRSSRSISQLKNYLKDLNIEYQEGSGFKNKIKKWVKL